MRYGYQVSDPKQSDFGRGARERKGKKGTERMHDTHIPNQKDNASS